MNEMVPTDRERNPFAREELPAVSTGGLISVEQQRAIAEVQARMIIARASPRNPIAAMDAILRDCTRPTLAKGALYSYPRGQQMVSGPSIRLAEAMAQKWGNIASGIKEISRADGYSECVAYAWDLETGYYDERLFQVRHWRDTKTGGYLLTDERDIYEIVANMGQRRKRAVLLTVIPGDVQEAATQQCEKTLHANADTSPEALQRMVSAFLHFGVTKEMIERRCACRMEAIRPAQVVQLSNIYQSIQDEMSSAADWFDMGDQPKTGTAGAWEQVSKRHEQSRQEQQQQTNKRPDPPTKEELRRQAAEKKAAKEAEETARAALAEQQRLEAEARRQQEEKAAADAASAQRREAPAEYYLCDEYGELIGDVHDTADSWANAFLDLYNAAGNLRPALMEANRDTLEEIERDAPSVDDRIRFGISEIEGIPGNDQPANEAPTFMQIPLETVRGKPDGIAYLKTYKTAVGMIGAHHYLDWIAAQLPLADLPASIRIRVVQAAVARAKELNIDPPATFQAKIEDTPPAETVKTDDAPATSTDTAEDKDAKQCAGWCADMDAVTSHSELIEFVQNKAISAKVTQWQASRPELHKRMQEASLRNDKRLKGGAP